jgi:hypothetical protein
MNKENREYLIRVEFSIDMGDKMSDVPVHTAYISSGRSMDIPVVNDPSLIEHCGDIVNRIRVTVFKEV